MEQITNQLIEQPLVIRVPEETNIIFGDVLRLLRPGVTREDVARNVQILAGTAMRRNVMYFDTILLRTPTERQLTAILSNMPNNTALVYPGLGAQAVQEEALMETADGYPIYTIPAKRIMNEGTVIGVDSSLTPSLESAIREGQINGIVVIDDVKVTAATLTAVKRQIEAIAPQPIEFASLVWFSYGQDAVPGYQLSVSVCRYISEDGKKPPFNSLSTWIRGDEKSAVVLDAYMQKYGTYRYGFTKQIEQIKKLTIL